MRTKELLRQYAGQREPPPERWQRLLWLAADLVRLSQIERKTWREGGKERRCKHRRTGGDEQMELNFVKEPSREGAME